MYIQVNEIGTTTYPYTLDMLKKANPNTSFPSKLTTSVLSSFGVFPVVIDVDPPFDATTYKVELSDYPEDINGKWVLKKVVVLKNQDEIAAQLEATKRSYELAVSQHLDTTVQAKGYDNIVSATSYAGYTNTFQAEGIAAGEWRSAVWSACYQILVDVEAGTRPTPTIDELIAELPTITWPA